MRVQIVWMTDLPALKEVSPSRDVKYSVSNLGILLGTQHSNCPEIRHEGVEEEERFPSLSL